MVAKPTDSNSLSAKTITERFNALEAGDELSVNNHKMTYEVIDTETYSVIAKDPEGHKVTFAQNLQTGGWSMSEEIIHIEKESS